MRKLGDVAAQLTKVVESIVTCEEQIEKGDFEDGLRPHRKSNQRAEGGGAPCGQSGLETLMFGRLVSLKLTRVAGRKACVHVDPGEP